MRSRKVRREGKRAVGRLARLRIRLLRRRALEEIRTEVAPGTRQLAPGERIARIELCRLRVELDRLAQIGFRAAGKIEPALQQGVVGLEAPARGPLALRRRVLTRQELRSSAPATARVISSCSAKRSL